MIPYQELLSLNQNPPRLGGSRFWLIAVSEIDSVNKNQAIPG